MIYARSVSVFPCEHRFDLRGKTEKRCAVCRMPITKEKYELDLFNTVTIFCCDTCKTHYVECIEHI